VEETSLTDGRPSTDVGAGYARSLVTRLLGRARAGCWPETVGETAPRPALRLKADTFAFRNDSRLHHHEKPDLYANWCFVLARAVRQFQRFARFEPAAPRLASEEYSALVRRVISRRVWRAPLPVAERVSIPGFESLYELSRADESAVKAGLLGTRFWTLVHPTNWRIAFPSRRVGQERVALKTVEDIREGRPVQFLVTDFPGIRLNHSVLAYDYRVASSDVIEFVVYDPNDPHAPGMLRFDRQLGRFFPVPLVGVLVPHIRAFRVYHSMLY
jgi:hypothetical protein